jgi:hypothetical protein
MPDFPAYNLIVDGYCVYELVSTQKKKGLTRTILENAPTILVVKTSLIMAIFGVHSLDMQTQCDHYSSLSKFKNKQQEEYWIKGQEWTNDCAIRVKSVLIPIKGNYSKRQTGKEELLVKGCGLVTENGVRKN